MEARRAKLRVRTVAAIALGLALLTGHYSTVHGWDMSVGTNTHYCGMYLLLTGHYSTVHGWDMSIGTNTHYCGLYLPHADIYCEHAS